MSGVRDHVRSLKCAKKLLSIVELSSGFFFTVMSDFARMPDDRFDEFAADEASLTEEQRQRRNALMEIIRAGQIGDDDGDGV